MKKAIIENGLVANIVEVDESDIPEWCVGHPEATDDAQIGGVYDGARFYPAPTKPAVDPGIVREKLKLSFAQLLIGLVSEAFITEQEGDAWLRGVLPQPVLDVIDTLPEYQRFAARAKATIPSEVLRSDPLVWSLADKRGMTPEQLDLFFMKYGRA